jgi:hypothetical protein
MGAVDLSLVAEGRLHLIESAGDIERLEFRKKDGAAVPRVDEGLLRRFVDVVLEVADR